MTLQYCNPRFKTASYPAQSIWSVFGLPKGASPFPLPYASLIRSTGLMVSPRLASAIALLISLKL
jgi:hypothetical protein